MVMRFAENRINDIAPVQQSKQDAQSIVGNPEK